MPHSSASVITLRTYAPDLHDRISAIMREPGIVEHFASQGPPEEQLADPHCDRAACALAEVDGRPAGAAIVVLVPGDPRWAMVRIGVRPDERRRGVGSALLRAVERQYGARPDAPQDVRMAAVVPSPPSECFAAAHGFTMIRRFAHMTWPANCAPEAVTWPEGVTVRTFDGSDEMVCDWVNTYNAAFREHWGWFAISEQDVRSIAREPSFQGDGLALAYRDGACIGYCASLARPEEGEIAVLCVTPDARGIGLGRALLRWGVAWLAPRAPRVALVVDAENAAARRLYDSEGFRTEAIRVVWSRALDCA